MEGIHPLDDGSDRRVVLYPFIPPQQQAEPKAADSKMYFGRRTDHLGGVYGRLYREPMAEMECLGLFPLPFQPLRANLPALFFPLVPSLYALMFLYFICKKEDLALNEKQPVH